MRVDVEKAYECEGTVACEFYGGVNVIKNGSECVKVLYSTDRVHSYHEDVVYVTPPYEGLERGT